MKSLFLFVPIMLLFNSALVAQYLPDGAKPVDHSAPREFCFSGIPLFMVDSLETSFDALIIENDKLEIIEMYSGTDVPEAFRDKAEQGLIIAKTADNTRLHRLEGVLDHFKVPQERRELRVLVNKGLIDADLLLADLERIKKVEVIKLNLAMDHVSWSLDPDEEYINISTLQQ